MTGKRPDITEEEICGTVRCDRCGAVSIVKGTSKNYKSPYCEKCRTVHELRRDLGCEVCNPKDPKCLQAPTGYTCPRRVF